MILNMTIDTDNPPDYEVLSKLVKWLATAKRVAPEPEIQKPQAEDIQNALGGWNAQRAASHLLAGALPRRHESQNLP